MYTSKMCISVKLTSPHNLMSSKSKKSCSEQWKSTRTKVWMQTMTLLTDVGDLTWGFCIAERFCGVGSLEVFSLNQHKQLVWKYHLKDWTNWSAILSPVIWTQQIQSKNICIDCRLWDKLLASRSDNNSYFICYYLSCVVQ